MSRPRCDAKYFDFMGTLENAYRADYFNARW
jgi:hypothetical protein